MVSAVLGLRWKEKVLSARSFWEYLVEQAKWQGSP